MGPGAKPAQGVVVVEVAWPPASAIDRVALGKLTAEAQAIVAAAPLPALVVADDVLLGRATVMAEPLWYALSTRNDSVFVSLQGTKAMHRHPVRTDAKPRHRVRGHDAWVTQNEAIWSASWIENGVAYSLEVECAALPDPRCDSESYVMELAGKIAFVGGEGAK